MKTVFLPAVFLVAAITLTGCGEIRDNRSVHTIAVSVTRHGHPARGQEVGVAIRTHRDAPYTVAQRVYTDRNGTARADFQATWANSVFAFPRIAPVPAEAPKPFYLVLAGGRQTPITPKTPGTDYHWNGERWETKTAVELP